MEGAGALAKSRSLQRQCERVTTADGADHARTGTTTTPVLSRSSKQYMASAAFPILVAASIALGGRVMEGKVYSAPEEQGTM